MINMKLKAISLAERLEAMSWLGAVTSLSLAITFGKSLHLERNSYSISPPVKPQLGAFTFLFMYGDAGRWIVLTLESCSPLLPVLMLS